MFASGAAAVGLSTMTRKARDMAKTYPPGSPAPRKGEFEAVGPRGGKTDQTATMKRPGDNLPPTDKPGQEWKPI